MSHEMPRRPYRTTVRAEQQDQTRRRITESAVHLHGTLGPARTSMSAVATHAGVRRSTLYRHFPDEASLLDACNAHWRAQNPPPDLAEWARVEAPQERLRRALGELHAFYRRTEPMLENLFRDEPVSPPLAERFAAFRGYLAQARDTLLDGRGVRGAAEGLVRGAVGHAIAFSTWRSLVRENGVADEDAVTLLCALVAAAGRRVRAPVQPSARRNASRARGGADQPGVDVAQPAPSPRGGDTRRRNGPDAATTGPVT